MSPSTMLLVLRARFKIAFLMFLMTAGMAIAVIERLPRQYTAKTELVVDVRAPDPVSAILRPSSMATQEDLVKSDRAALRVVKILNLDENEVARSKWRKATGGEGRFDVWLGELLQKNLTVSPPRRDSNILTIEYSAADPVFAAAVANAFAQAYVEIAVELKVEPAKQYARWFADQGKLQRENFEKAQARLSEFQQRRGIVAKDETLDTETHRLADLMTQLTALQAQTADASSKERTGTDTLPELLQNPVIAGLRQDIARQEAKLKDAAGNLGPNHPRYKSMEAELAELKTRLKEETRHALNSYKSATSVGVDKEKQLKVAIEAQKRKLLQLRSERDDLAVLQRDVDTAKNAYAAVANRYAQASLESQSTQTNVFLLNPAVAPVEASSPKILKLTVMASLLAVLAGLGAALAMEIIDRRVRSAEDLFEMLHLPVLTVVPGSSVRRPGMRALPAP